MPEAARGKSDPSFRQGRQYVSIRYTQRLAEAGLVASVGSVGDSYDNALAGTINGLYKTELIYRQGHGKTGKLLNWPHSNGWIGSIIAAFCHPLETSPRQKLRLAFMLSRNHML